MIVPIIILAVALYRFRRMKVVNSRPNQTTIWIHWLLAVLAFPAYGLGSFESKGKIMFISTIVAY